MPDVFVKVLAVPLRLLVMVSTLPACPEAVKFSTVWFASNLIDVAPVEAYELLIFPKVPTPLKVSNPAPA